MNRKAKFLSLMIILNIMLSICINCFKFDVNATTQSISSDINAIDNNLYPAIKSMINSLKSSHPNWNFKILYTDIEFKDAVMYEYMGHEDSPKSLVPANNSKYDGCWICPICGKNDFDTGKWYCASESAIKYMMDPRNSLNSNDIFQFLELSYDSSYNYDKNIVASMLKDSFLDNSTYIDIIMDTCKNYNANPYYIVARILQEQGKGGKTLTKGEGYNGEYVGLYNIFNIGASGKNEEAVIINGFKKAQANGWTSLEISLREGIKFITEKYISVGQNTMYLQKFDVDNSDGNMFWHQYMQNILAAQNEGTTLRKTLQDNNAVDLPYTFIIPVYKNMPSVACPRPATDKPSTTIETDVVRINVNNKIQIRKAPNGASTGEYLYSGEVATRLDRATEKVNGTYWDKIIKSNGVTGYVARSTSDSESEYKQYLIQLNNNDDYSGSNGNVNNNSVDGNSVGTLSEETNQKGDINGDNKIDSMDMYKVIQHILGNISFTDCEKKSADLNNDDRIDSMDMYLMIQKIINN